MTPDAESLVGCHTGYCGCVTPCKGSGGWGHPVDYGCVTQERGSGERVTLITVDV